MIEINKPIESNLLHRKNEKFRVYVSVDPNRIRLTHKKEELSEFVVLVFDYSYNQNTVYIKFPYTDSFVEMYGGLGHSRSGKGYNMETYRIRNVAKERENMSFFDKSDFYKREMNLFLDEKNGMLEDLSDFEFLTRLTTFESEKYLKLNVITLPKEYEISYALKINQNVLFVFHETFKFDYDTMRLFYGNKEDGFKEYKIHDFVRYRDGGTTEFKFYVDNTEMDFYHPSSFYGDKIKKLNNDTMITLDKSEIKEFLDCIDIVVSPEAKK